jgi:tRNA 2-thiouridine synthesizing protein A
MSAPFAMYGRMTTTKLDLTGLKCPLPALKTRKALKALNAGDLLEVHCTDPLSVIDIPNLIRETGDKVEITERAEHGIVFLIEKANGLIEKATGSPPAVTGRSRRNQDG